MSGGTGHVKRCTQLMNGGTDLRKFLHEGTGSSPGFAEINPTGRRPRYKLIRLDRLILISLLWICAVDMHMDLYN